MRDLINKTKIFGKLLNENKSENLINKILDKIQAVGFVNISPDEKDYLQQYNNKDINSGLENWLLNDSDETFDLETGKKLLYSEFEEDEDIYYNMEKLIRILTNFFKQEPVSNNADWGGGYAWYVKSREGSNDKLYIHYVDDSLALVSKSTEEDEEADVIEYIDTPKELYKVLLNIKKDKY